MKRVLLVEDDAAIRRFVRLALEDMTVDLAEAATLAESLDQLRAMPVALVLTDLMLPDGSGIDLLRTLQADPALRAGARLAVFSAGVSAARRDELRDLDVSEVLEKPASVTAVAACVQAALDTASPADAAARETPQAAFSAEEARAIAEHFGGNAELFVSFRAMSRAQIAADLQAGDSALARGDRPALRRTAHNLKSVLRLMGHAPASQLARTLEAAAAADAPAQTLAEGWQSLRAAVGATMSA